MGERHPQRAFVDRASMARRKELTPMILDFHTGLLSTDAITMQYRAPLQGHANPVVVLDVGDVELIEESVDQGGDEHGFPPAISDWELIQLVDECTSELCQLEAYRYGAYTG